MFTLFAPLLALFAAQSVYGTVTPTGPGGSDVFKAGSQCLTTWKGDTDSPSPWKSMDIELMSGDNFHMVHVTTVATNQDGSKDGQFSFPCPDVTPFSAIYFYQYTATGAQPTWTTRFTIAAEDGSTTPPANSTQPDGKSIPWGVGQLTDQSKVVPPPASAGGTGSVDTGSTSSSNSSSSPAPATGSSTSVAVAGTTAPATVGETSAASPSSPSASTTNSASRFVTSTIGSAAAQSTSPAAASAAANSTSTAKPGSGAVALKLGGWKVVSLTVGVAGVFGLLL